MTFLLFDHGHIRKVGGLLHFVSSTVLTARLTTGYLEGSLLHYYELDNYFGLLKHQHSEVDLSLAREIAFVVITVCSDQT